MTGDDLKRMQDNFLESGKKILLEHGRLRPVGFVITLHKHLDKLFESGWGLEFIDPKSCMRGNHEDDSAVLILDLLMDWKRLYHAVLNVFPQTRDVLPPMIALAQKIAVDDPYMRVMRSFLAHTRMDEKDIIAATMRHVCEKVDAFACIMQTEAWMRVVEEAEDADKIPARLGDDQKSVEILVSSMETYDFARMITVPIHRQASARTPVQATKRDEGKVVGFGDQAEGLDTTDNTNVVEGRFVRFLKPLGVAS